MMDWRLLCLIAVHLTLGLTEEAVPSNDLKTVNENEGARSGAVSAESTETVASSEAEETRAGTIENNGSSETNRFFGNLGGDTALNNLGYIPQRTDQLLPLDLGRFPGDIVYNNPISNQNDQSATQVLRNNGVPSTDSMTADQVLESRSNSHGINSPKSGIDQDDEEDQDEAETQEAFSRLIPYSERILLHQIPGANKLLTCSREGELHNFWSSAYQCLVCACIRDTGVLRPVCASCSGCMVPQPDIEVYTEKPYITEAPVTIYTPPLEEEVTCKPLPSGQPFENPLHPCQVCICIESVNAYGKPDVKIQCQENPQCVLPTDATVLPPIPDVPVPSPFCDKFPLNVLFPHPSDSCKTCRCSVHVTQLGFSEKQITCIKKSDCPPGIEIITELPGIPIEPEIIPEIVPIYETETIKPTPVPWTPATVAPPHIGPLPGPSPHDSCRPYLPNQPFQHPWNECEMCVCTEAIAKNHITIEISCFTKKSCCIELPFDIITPATLPPATYKPSGKLRFTDAICEYKTFGVEFVHPKDSCNICTCELQGRLITPLCKRSSKPECQLIAIYPSPTLPLVDIIQENKKLSLPGAISYNAGASSSQNKAIKNAFVSYQNLYGATGQLGSGQSLADQQATLNLENYQKPGDLGLRPQNLQLPSRPGGSTGVYGQNQLGNQQYYGSQYGNRPNLAYPHYNPGQGYQGKPGTGAYVQNYNSGFGQFNQGYPGYPPGLLRPAEVVAQTQAQASSSSAAAASDLSNSYAYNPGLQYPGQSLNYPGNPGKIRQYAQSSASAQSSAQASAVSATKYKSRSGNQDDNESVDKEN